MPRQHRLGFAFVGLLFSLIPILVFAQKSSANITAASSLPYRQSAGLDVLAGAIFESQLNIAQTGAVHVFSLPLKDGGLAYLPALARQALMQTTNLITYMGPGKYGGFDIYVATADGLGRTNLTNTTEDEFGPTWSPDGQRIAFSREHDSRIHIMNMDGSNETTISLPPNSASPSRLAWSPDGSRFAFDALTGTYSLYMINIDGSGFTILTADDAIDETSAAWSPDGQTIAFLRANNVWLLNLATGVETLVDGADLASPSRLDWSFDGTTILYARFDHGLGGPSLYQIAAIGGTPQLVVAGATDGRWSPDGSQLVFTGSNWGVFRADADGNNITVIDADSNSLEPDWQPSP